MKYAKAIVAVAGAVLVAITTQFPDNSVVQQWGPIVTSLLTAVSVYVVPNAPNAKPFAGNPPNGRPYHEGNR
jgi:hypothetical protein